MMYDRKSYFLNLYDFTMASLSINAKRTRMDRIWSLDLRFHMLPHLHNYQKLI